MSFPAYVPSGSQASPGGVPSTSLLKRAAGSTAPGTSRDDPSLPELPAKYDPNDLRAAVGASPIAALDKRSAVSDRSAAIERSVATDRSTATDRPAVTIDADHHDDVVDDRDDPRRPRGSRSVLLAVLAIAALVGAGVLALLGYLNSDRYVLACESERAVPERGRGFPPWGTRTLAGDAWRPLPITAETRCRPLETDDMLVLQRSFLAMVLDQVTALLTAREVTKVDAAEALLKQALLLTRPPEHEADAQAKQRTEQHQQVERMLGDVAYWRATAKVRDAAAALGEAARQFDAAVAQRPKHVTDAAAWSAYARKLTQQLQAGPAGLAPVAGTTAGSAGSAPVTGTMAGSAAAAPVPGTTAGAAGTSTSPGVATAAPSSSASSTTGSAGPGDPPATTGGAPGAGSAAAAGSNATAGSAATAVERPASPPGTAGSIEPGKATGPPAAPPPDAGAPSGVLL